MNYENPVKRTSVTVPNNGYAIVRFKADNPGTGIHRLLVGPAFRTGVPNFWPEITFRLSQQGMWLLHCHTFTHLMEGQAILLDVTDKGVPPVPPNFPTCPVHEVTPVSNELVQLKSIGNSNTNSARELTILSLSILILSLIL